MRRRVHRTQLPCLDEICCPDHPMRLPLRLRLLHCRHRRRRSCSCCHCCRQQQPAQPQLLPLHASAGHACVPTHGTAATLAPASPVRAAYACGP
eukprot:365325-Chlamydomonas_euryale.AAC.34